MRWPKSRTVCVVVYTQWMKTERKCYRWPLNDEGVKGHWHLLSQNLYNLTPPKLRLSLFIHRGLVPGPPWIPKSLDAQVPYIKWHRSVHTAGSPHLWTPSHGSKTVQVFTEKNARINGPELFEAHLYFWGVPDEIEIFSPVGRPLLK